MKVVIIVHFHIFISMPSIFLMNNYKKFFYNPPYQGQRDYLPLAKIWLSLIFKINDRYGDIINMQVF